MSNDIRNKIEDQMEKILEENIKVVDKEKIIELITIFKNLDSDLIPILEIIEYSINNIPSPQVQSVVLTKLLRFYGLGKEVDILKTRQKISMVEHKLVKKPFLKKENIEMINILLQENNIV